VNDFLAGLLGALLTTNQPIALSNVIHNKTGLAITIPARNDPIEQEFQKLMADDDTAQEEVNQWIAESGRLPDKGQGIESVSLRARIKQRFDSVKKAYEDFMNRHPQHARARLAYGSFLCDIGEEGIAFEHLEKARQLDPSNAAAWNNLANWHGHNGGVSNSFKYYAKAIELAPTEPIYYQNFATTVFLFRHDAANFYNISLQQVFDKAMDLYRKALALDPDNFLLAADYAQSYYGFKPPNSGDEQTDRKAEQKFADEALAAWQTALKLARDDVEREGVLIHFARIQINAGRFEQARKNLNAVTNETLATTKSLLTKKLLAQEAKASSTNTPSGTAK
jgi:tetratricopeptide (TPR) repeat protein